MGVKKVPEGEVSKVEAFPVGFLLVAEAPIFAKRRQGERSSNDPAGIEHSNGINDNNDNSNNNKNETLMTMEACVALMMLTPNFFPETLVRKSILGSDTLQLTINYYMSMFPYQLPELLISFCKYF